MSGTDVFRGQDKEATFSTTSRLSPMVVAPILGQRVLFGLPYCPTREKILPGQVAPSKDL